MYKVAKLRSGWCNRSASCASYSWRLEEAARVFDTSPVNAVLNWRVLDMAFAGASGNVTVEDQRSYIRIETLRGKNPTEIPRGGEKVQLYSFFNHGARWGGWSTPRPSHFTPGKTWYWYCIGGWVGPRVGLDGCGKPRPHRDSIPGTSSL